MIATAHRASQRARRPERRLVEKLALAKRLYGLGFDRQGVIELFRFVDWILTLPEGLDRAFHREIERFEEETRMPYITSIERIGIEKGRQEEALRVVSRLLARKVGCLDESRAARLRQLPPDRLEELGEALLDFAALDDLDRWMEGS